MSRGNRAKLRYLTSFLVCLSCSANAEEGWFGLNAVEAETSGFFLNPTVDSLTVREVASGSPAAKQLIRPGDIVLSIDGEAVPGNKARQLYALLDKTVGAELVLQLERTDGTKYVVTLFATRKPVQKAEE